MGSSKRTLRVPRQDPRVKVRDRVRIRVGIRIRGRVRATVTVRVTVRAGGSCLYREAARLVLEVEPALETCEQELGGYRLRTKGRRLNKPGAGIISPTAMLHLFESLSSKFADAETVIGRNLAGITEHDA